MPLQTLEHQTGAGPQSSIIVLHGLSADGSDFVPIAQELDLSKVGAGRFVCIQPPPSLPSTAFDRCARGGEVRLVS